MSPARKMDAVIYEDGYPDNREVARWPVVAFGPSSKAEGIWLPIVFVPERGAVYSIGKALNLTGKGALGYKLEMAD